MHLLRPTRIDVDHLGVCWGRDLRLNMITKTNHRKLLIQRRIDATEKQIYQLVYALYGLTNEEIKVVEGVIK